VVFNAFLLSGRNLLAAEAAAGVGHHVALSVVGTDRLLASGYFRAKMAQENHFNSGIYNGSAQWHVSVWKRTIFDALATERQSP
jgi:hypothetical protein